MMACKQTATKKLGPTKRNCLWRNLLWAHGIYSTHYMGDITKLAHNEVDDLNYTILQMLRNNSEETQICGIHGYKYLY
ncbi:unnamed protein product [Rhizophagus irregularis]|nr:unnamed protein product [Rhizophagus irregularis]